MAGFVIPDLVSKFDVMVHPDPRVILSCVEMTVKLVCWLSGDQEFCQVSVMLNWQSGDFPGLLSSHNRELLNWPTGTGVFDKQKISVFILLKNFGSSCKPLFPCTKVLSIAMQSCFPHSNHREPPSEIIELKVSTSACLLSTWGWSVELNQALNGSYKRVYL